MVKAFRGMMVEVPLPISVMPGSDSPEEMRACLMEHYAGSRVVTVHSEMAPSELLILNTQEPSDKLDLYVMGSPKGDQVRLLAMLDNLGKGASGAAATRPGGVAIRPAPPSLAGAVGLRVRRPGNRAAVRRARRSCCSAAEVMTGRACRPLSAPCSLPAASA